MKNLIKDRAIRLLKSAGITVNGSEPWDIQIHNEKIYQRVWRKTSLGLGESYMDGWWDCQRLDMFFDRILRLKVEASLKQSLSSRIQGLLLKFINEQTRHGARAVAKTHYDLGNELFRKMLDSQMIYSCAYWRDTTVLEEAQLAKMELICQKLQLKPGMRLLDVGCGWGGLARHAAMNYGVSVVAITISQEQYKYAKELCKNLPVEIRLQDYRDVTEQFDRIASIAMFENVGYLNYKTYMQAIARALRDDGLFLLHTIGVNHNENMTDEWIRRYIFPNGVLPYITQISEAVDKIFVMEDWHNFGAHYDKTLMAWHENFINHWDSLKSQYDDRFYRMWNYYLLSTAGCFRARAAQLWQIVFSKDGIVGGYSALR